MTGPDDFRDLLARSVILGTRVWGLAETLVPPKMVEEIAWLGDETTFLNALGISPTEDGNRLSQLSSFLDSDEVVDALSYEGERWRVTDIATAANEILQEVGNSLAANSTPGRVGRLLRAIPIMAASRFTDLGNRLAQVLMVDPIPEALIVAYGETFCRRDEEILVAVDQVILKDKVLGTVAVELAGRLMLKLGYDGIYLDKKSREALINCLVLLIGSVKEKVVSSNAGIDRQNTREEIA